MSIPQQILTARQEAKWDLESVPKHRTLIGKTVGLLVSRPCRVCRTLLVSYPSRLNCSETWALTSLQGYGHIARETARLFKALNCKIIAANSTGKRAADTGVSLPPLHTLSPGLPLHAGTMLTFAVCRTRNWGRGSLNTVRNVFHLGRQLVQ